MTRVWCDYEGTDALCLPFEVFYPAPNRALHPTTFKTPHSLAIHHWASTWQTATPPNPPSLESNEAPLPNDDDDDDDEDDEDEGEIVTVDVELD